MWPKIITIKRTKDLNYFSLCALNLFNTRVSQFELNYWNKWTFTRHSNWDAPVYDIPPSCVRGKTCVSATVCPWAKMAASMLYPSKCAVKMDRDANGQLSRYYTSLWPEINFLRKYIHTNLLSVKSIINCAAWQLLSNTVCKLLNLVSTSVQLLVIWQ